MVSGVNPKTTTVPQEILDAHAALDLHEINRARTGVLPVARALADRAAAALLLLLLLPVMFVIGALVWGTDRGPVFYGHFRIGRHGQVFRCLKFRSMRIDAQQMLERLLAEDESARAAWESERKLANDPRITSIGQFLRKTSLDELPQLFNVLRGEMALVGPRPIVYDELALYGRSRWHYLSVLPGMTGLWQVSGRSNTSYDERVALDRHYVMHRSLAMDAGILLRTVKVVLTRDGAR